MPEKLETILKYGLAIDWKNRLKNERFLSFTCDKEKQIIEVGAVTGAFANVSTINTQVFCNGCFGVKIDDVKPLQNFLGNRSTDDEVKIFLNNKQVTFTHLDSSWTAPLLDFSDSPSEKVTFLKEMQTENVATIKINNKKLQDFLSLAKMLEAEVICFSNNEINFASPEGGGAIEIHPLSINTEEKYKVSTLTKHLARVLKALSQDKIIINIVYLNQGFNQVHLFTIETAGVKSWITETRVAGENQDNKKAVATTKKRLAA